MMGYGRRGGGFGQSRFRRGQGGGSMRPEPTMPQPQPAGGLTIPQQPRGGPVQRTPIGGGGGRFGLGSSGGGGGGFFEAGRRLMQNRFPRTNARISRRRGY